MRLTLWENRLSKNLRAPWLDSIRNKILAFAAVATLIPSLTTAWISYTENRRSLTDLITGQLESRSTQTARELDLWLKERQSELKVFAASYEVSENLEPVARGQRQALNRINNYLSAVRGRFAVYDELVVIDLQGRAINSNQNGHDPTLHLPSDWRSDIRAENPVVGQGQDETLGKTAITLGVPIRTNDGRIVGALTARLNLRSLEEILNPPVRGREPDGVQRSQQSASGHVYLVDPKGSLIVGSGAPADSQAHQAALDPDALELLKAKEGTAVAYIGMGGQRVLGNLVASTGLGWYVIAELPTEEAFRQIGRLRNVTLMVLVALLSGVGAMAYFLSMLIVRPLDRLTKGASRVAEGDLGVDLPVVSRGEVGYLTRVFNDMVVRLREGRQALAVVNETLRRQNEELERLSVTDGLTGLYNRRFLMTALANEVHRTERLNHSFSVLMADVDHFKRYNDTLGHQAGDEVLVRVAAVLRECTREIDCAARYGGEEFIVLLPETKMAGGVEVAERVRARLARESFPGGRITLSIGVAESPQHGETPVTIIGSADAALYRAKREGRDRIERAGRRLSGEQLQEPA